MRRSKLAIYETPNSRLKLSNGKSDFGSIPEINTKGIFVPTGKIYLKKGKHVGPNRGFGASHIWAEHQKEMESLGFLNPEDVPAYVETIIKSGSSIHCEFSQIKGFQKLSILRNPLGTAILEYKGQPPNGHYSVVTAFSGNKKHGPKIGTVL